MAQVKKNALQRGGSSSSSKSTTLRKMAMTFIMLIAFGLLAMVRMKSGKPTTTARSSTMNTKTWTTTTTTTPNRLRTKKDSISSSTTMKEEEEQQQDDDKQKEKENLLAMADEEEKEGSKDKDEKEDVEESNKEEEEKEEDNEETKEEDTKAVKSDEKEARQCSIYMAESSIKGVTSMGIYTLRDLNPGDELLQGGPDGPSITLLSDHYRGASPRFPDAITWLRMWGNYAWGLGKGVPDHIAYEGLPNSIFEHQTTFGALPNHHCILQSLAFHFPHNNGDAFDDSLHETESPMAGAITYNEGRDWTVNRMVHEGEEVFLNYGHCARPYPEWIPNEVPTRDEYKDAADYVVAITKEKKKDGDGDVANVKFPKNKHVKKLLSEETLQELEKKMKDGIIGETDLAGIARFLAKTHEIEPRSTEWIREHGKCLEHLHSKASEVYPEAGHGGFAQHTIAKGEIIVPSPMVHVMDHDTLATYDTVETGKQIGYQVVLNYCFGHLSSTLLMCPNTNALLINHCMSDDDRCRVNAKVVWAQDDATSEHWRTNYTLRDLSREKARGLVTDIVALEDIHPGDEVFLDYGKDWEDAYKEHVKKWKNKTTEQRPLKVGGHMSVKHANDAWDLPETLMSGSLHTPWEDDYLMPTCRYHAGGKIDSDKERYTDDVADHWRTWNETEVLTKFGTDGSKYKNHNYENHHDFNYWPCTIVRKEEEEGDDGTNNYLVRLFPNPFAETQVAWENGEGKVLPRFIYHYPREAIQFMVHPASGDQYQPRVFRHPIAFPEELFPKQWKNL